MLKIIKNPDPRLRLKSVEIKEITEEIKAFIPELVETMIKKDGVGLASPQVGKNIRLIAVRLKDDNMVLINPQIIKKSLIKEWGEEGCLSVPGVYGEVKRCKKITVKFIDAEGKKRTITAEGFFARIIQHETDHLDGILFIDKARKLEDVE